MLFSRKITFFIVPFLLFGCISVDKQSSETLHSNSTELNVVHADSLLLDRQDGLTYYLDQPFSGTAVTRYANDSLATSVQFVRGRREGFFQKWFRDGKLSYKAHYSAGKQHGKSYSWWSNGNLRTESHFSNGIPNGVQLQYYKSGARFKRINLVDGREEGVQQSWRENGKLYNNYEARNGRIFGLKRSKLCYKLDDEEVQYK